MQAPAGLPLRNALLAKFALALPNDLFVVHADGDDVATIPAKHSAVGDLTVRDDGDELVVHLGKLAHRHFGNYDDKQSPEQRADDIASQVLQFVQAMLNDEVQIFGNGRGGGRRKRDLKPRGALSR